MLLLVVVTVAMDLHGTTQKEVSRFAPVKQ